ncbi:MAG: TlpA disulfide reductase family protein [Rhodoglobus sp.]
MTPRRPVVIASLAVLAVLLAGCTEPSNVGPVSNSSADDTIVEIAPTDRGDPIVFGGPLEDGASADSSDWLGSVVVVNFWYAACPPCRAEAPDLEAVHQRFLPDGVVFVGVNVRDSAATASSFATKFEISYPSIIDTNDGSVQLAFAGQIAPNAVPTTIVLDREGRPAARIVGRIPSQTTLATLIQDVLAEEDQ